MTGRLIAIITVGRSDYSIYKPILHAIAARGDLQYGLVVSGGHLSADQDRTVTLIESEDEPILARVPMLLAADDPHSIATAIGVGTIGFGEVFARVRPDFVLVLGDRFEMHAAAVAAVPFGIPVAHVHGGEITEGAIDEQFRHSLTKLSHLHFVSTYSAAKRVVQMGEEEWRVVRAGAPSLDNLRNIQPLGRKAFFSQICWADPGPFLLVTYHPVTFQPNREESQIAEVLKALGGCGMPLLFTLANADAGGRRINDAIRAFVERTEEAKLVSNLGDLYFSAMAHAAAMVGNSSSGIIEAASFGLPVVNVGIRQAGRERGKNVIDCGNSRSEIAGALAHALDPEFRSSLSERQNIYGDGHAAEGIVDALANTPINERLLRKRFIDRAVQSTDALIAHFRTEIR
jgi:UDP-hydrolysing UDP-N-acetyl-D-glucosamine 2-epimerase